MKEWFVSELQEALAKSAHDVQMAVEYLSERGDVDMNNVGIFGVGAGGHHRGCGGLGGFPIKAIDLVAPWGDWPGGWRSRHSPGEERPKLLQAGFLKNVRPLTRFPCCPH